MFAIAALRITEFRYILLTRFLITLAVQMQYTLIGWQIYSLTNDYFALSLSGLFEAIPFILISLVSGYIADSFDRKRVFLSALFFLIFASLFVVIYEYLNPTTSYQTATEIIRTKVFGYYLALGVLGLTRGFMGPSLVALWGEIVPRELYANAATWNTTSFTSGQILGPAIGGIFLSQIGMLGSSITVFILLLSASISMMLVRRRGRPLQSITQEPLYEKLTAGLRYVFSKQVLVSAMALDMFAVLFGGAVSLIPSFVKDVLHAGPDVAGWLRSAPSAGAILMGIIVAFYPPNKKTGIILLGCVAGFGISMMAFSLSTNLYLSMIILGVGGAFDMVSMVIRGSITQILTPENMRGRVASVNGVFIGSSNEIGTVESGLAAAFFGLVPSVVIGSSVTLVVVAITAILASELRKFSIKNSA